MFVLLAGYLVDAPYLVVQGSHALVDLLSARRFDRVVDPSAAERLLFRQAAAIRRYGSDEVGLSESKSYTRYRRVEREALVWVVSAVNGTSWDRYLWRYPFVGALPYRGFYQEGPAKQEAKSIEDMGYDVTVRRVTAYSFLGFVPDPLYSFALDAGHWQLAEVILHEMAHATLFLPGRAGFNENFATFVGLEGSRQYMATVYGAGSSEYADMMNQRHDRDVARGLMLDLHRELVSLFDDASGDSPEDLLEAKAEIYEEFAGEVSRDYEKLFSSGGYRWLAENRMNNAVVDLFVTYSADLEVFYDLLEEHDGSLSAVVAYLRGGGAAAMISENPGS